MNRNIPHGRNRESLSPVESERTATPRTPPGDLATPPERNVETPALRAAQRAPSNPPGTLDVTGAVPFLGASALSGLEEVQPAEPAATRRYAADSMAPFTPLNTGEIPLSAVQRRAEVSEARNLLAMAAGGLLGFVLFVLVVGALLGLRFLL